MKYSEQISISDAQKEKTKRAFDRLKKRKPKNLDDLFQQAHDEAFRKIDCMECANCCKTTSPIFRDVDIQRISKKLKMATRDFELTYLRKDEDNDWVLQSSPCHFLGADNKCFIYDVRPQACREYPHTDRKRIVQILDLTRKNMEICPAVVFTVEKVLKDFD